jgi:hypothetical protein
MTWGLRSAIYCALFSFSLSITLFWTLDGDFADAMDTWEAADDLMVSNYVLYISFYCHMTGSSET